MPRTLIATPIALGEPGEHEEGGRQPVAILEEEEGDVLALRVAYDFGSRAFGITPRAASSRSLRTRPSSTAFHIASPVRHWTDLTPTSPPRRPLDVRLDDLQGVDPVDVEPGIAHADDGLEVAAQAEDRSRARDTRGGATSRP